MTGRFGRRITGACLLVLLLSAAAACSPGLVRPSPFTSSPLASPLATPGSRADAAALLSKGDTFYTAGQYDEALDAYNQAIQAHADPARAYEARGNAYAGLRRFDDAIADYTESLKALRDPRVLTSRCNAYRNFSDFAQAEADCQAAVALLPGSADAHATLALVYDEEHNSDAANKEIAAAIALDPKSVNAHYVQSQLFTKAGQYDQAIAELSRCIELAPQQPKFYLQRGELYLALAKVDQAKADMNAVLQYGKPESDGELLLQAGTVLRAIEGQQSK